LKLLNGNITCESIPPNPGQPTPPSFEWTVDVQSSGGSSLIVAAQTHKKPTTASITGGTVRNHLAGSGYGYTDVIFNFSLTVPGFHAAPSSSITSGNAIAFNDPELSNVAFSFPIVGQPGKYRYLYGRKSVLLSRCAYFVDMFRFSEPSASAKPDDSPPKSTTIEPDVGDVDQDSDYDPDEDIDAEDVPSLKSGTKPFQIGVTQYRTWRAMLFYLETGCVFFAPLRSSFREYDETSSENTWRDYARRHRTAISAIEGDFPYESSPKSLYSLADMMELESLKTLAFDQIKASFTTANILKELVSPITFKYEAIKAAEFSYLKDHWAEVRQDKAGVRKFLQPLRSVEMNQHWEDLLVDLILT